MPCIPRLAGTEGILSVYEKLSQATDTKDKTWALASHLTKTLLFRTEHNNKDNNKNKEKIKQEKELFIFGNLNLSVNTDIGFDSK